MSGPTSFGLVGAGWRAQFFLRIAAALPDRFRCVGVVTRDAGRAEVVAALGVPVFSTLDALAAARPAFAVVAVPRAVAPDVLEACAGHGMPALAETPPAADLSGLRRVWELVHAGLQVQVAEQYQFQPMHAARLALVRQGRIGTPDHIHISVAHGYHGISLMRLYLGVGFRDAEIWAEALPSRAVTGPSRAGPPAEERVTTADQVIAQFRFGYRSAIYDFTMEQYFSWIRAPRLLVRGERGEIQNDDVRWLRDFRTPSLTRLLRDDAGQGGNLEGWHHRGVQADGDWVYRNPFAPARLSDEEIAVAACLDGMATWLEGGPGLYSFADAAQDQYLNLLMEQARASGEAVRSERQPWATA